MERPQEDSPPKWPTPIINNHTPNLSPPFGHIGDFWKRYDELADLSDREMVENLNGNLDVLLIFVSFFLRIYHVVVHG